MSKLKLTILAAVFLVAAGVAVAAKGGDLPEPKEPGIAPPNARGQGAPIGGVILGMSLKSADKAWGKTGDCKTETEGGFKLGTCTYGKENSKFGNAAIFTANDKVTEAFIQAGKKFDGPLLEFATKKGKVGLGDKLSKLKKAYPDGDYSDTEATFPGGEPFPEMIVTAENGKIVRFLLTSAGG